MPVPPKSPQPSQGKPTQEPPIEKQKLPQKQSPEKPPVQKEPKKKTPAQKKDDHLKYEMKYLNGGFNNGVEIKPDRDGKAQVKISIYGGGEQKTLSISPLPTSIAKLVQAYELSANQDENTPEITGELQKYFEEVNTKLSQKIIAIFQRADEEVASAIKSSFKEVNQGY